MEFSQIRRRIDHAWDIPGYKVDWLQLETTLRSILSETRRLSEEYEYTDTEALEVANEALELVDEAIAAYTKRGHEFKRRG